MGVGRTAETEELEGQWQEQFRYILEQEESQWGENGLIRGK